MRLVSVYWIVLLVQMVLLFLIRFLVYAIIEPRLGQAVSFWIRLFYLPVVQRRGAMEGSQTSEICGYKKNRTLL